MSSFYELLGQRDYAASPTFQRPRTQSPTPKQISTYLDMCRDRKLSPVNYVNFSVKEMSAEMDRIKTLRSRAQIDKIYEKIGLIREIGINLDSFLMNVDFNTLTAGREGTASKLIEELFAIERECNTMLPPTDEQLDQIMSWMLCPDVPFEDFDIPRTKEIGNNFWRRLTPDEFRVECAEHLKRNEASKLIDDFRGMFYDWRKTRISKGKMDYIRNLESRLISIYTPKEETISVDLHGNRVVNVEHKVKDNGIKYDPIAFVPLTDDELLMFNNDEAEMYISILKAEGRRKYYSQSLDGDLTFEELRTINNSEDVEDSSVKKADNIEVACDLDYKELQSSIFRLEAIAGYKNDEAHDVISSLLTKEEYNSEEITYAKSYLRDYMLFLVDEGYCTLQGMAGLITDSKLLTDLLIGRMAA